MGILVTPTMDMSNFDTTVPHQPGSNHGLLRAAPSTAGSASSVCCRMRQTGITAITDLYSIKLCIYIKREFVYFFIYFLGTITIFTSIEKITTKGYILSYIGSR